jgi:hypothetical protein
MVTAGTVLSAWTIQRAQFMLSTESLADFAEVRRHGTLNRHPGLGGFPATARRVTKHASLVGRRDRDADPAKQIGDHGDGVALLDGLVDTSRCLDLQDAALG